MKNRWLPLLWLIFFFGCSARVYRADTNGTGLRSDVAFLGPYPFSVCMNEGIHCTILAVGDSITEQNDWETWDAEMAAQYPNLDLDIRKFGLTGFDSTQMTAATGPLKKLQYDVNQTLTNVLWHGDPIIPGVNSGYFFVALKLGVNDCLHCYDPATYVAKTAVLVEAFQSQGAFVVVSTQTPPDCAHWTQAYTNTKCQNVNLTCEEFTARAQANVNAVKAWGVVNGIPVLDTFTALKDNPAFVTGDGVHPTTTPTGTRQEIARVWTLLGFNLQLNAVNPAGTLPYQNGTVKRFTIMTQQTSGRWQLFVSPPEASFTDGSVTAPYRLATLRAFDNGVIEMFRRVTWRH